MDTRQGLLIGLLAACIVGTPALAKTNVDLSINIGPPPPVVEVVPDPRPGYVWRPAIGIGTATSTHGPKATGFASGMAMCGRRTSGNSAATAGITGGGWNRG
jgi:hypothetical protein